MSRVIPHPGKPGRIRTRNRHTLCTLATAATLALTGCSSASSPATPAPTAADAKPSASTPSPAASSAAPLAAEKAAIVSTYDRYLAQMAQAYEQVDWKSTDVRKYVSGETLKQVHADVQSLKGAGNHMTGAPTSDSKVTKITMTGPVPTATLTTCLDVSKWDTVDASGKSLPPIKGQLKRYIVVSSLEKWPNGWMVLREKAEARTCVPNT